MYFIRVCLRVFLLLFFIKITFLGAGEIEGGQNSVVYSQSTCEEREVYIAGKLGNLDKFTEIIEETPYLKESPLMDAYLLGIVEGGHPGQSHYK